MSALPNPIPHSPPPAAHFDPEHLQFLAQEIISRMRRAGLDLHHLDVVPLPASDRLCRALGELEAAINTTHVLLLYLLSAAPQPTLARPAN